MVIVFVVAVEKLICKSSKMVEMDKNIVQSTTYTMAKVLKADSEKLKIRCISLIATIPICLMQIMISTDRVRLELLSTPLIIKRSACKN